MHLSYPMSKPYSWIADIRFMIMNLKPARNQYVNLWKAYEYNPVPGVQLVREINGKEKL